MENNLNQTSQVIDSSVKTKKSFKIKGVLKVSYGVFLLAALGVMGYLGYVNLKKMNNNFDSYNASINDLNAQISYIQEQNNFNKSRIDTIASAQANSSQSNYTTFTPVYASIGIEKVLEDKNSALENGFRFIILDIKLENKSQNDIYYSTGELKLKDSDNFEYNYYGQGSYTEDYVKKDTKVLLPDNRIPLNYATIKPGETVKGSAVFVINRPGTKFTLLRNGEVLKNISL